MAKKSAPATAKAPFAFGVGLNEQAPTMLRGFQGWWNDSQLGMNGENVGQDEHRIESVSAETDDDVARVSELQRELNFDELENLCAEVNLVTSATGEALLRRLDGGDVVLKLQEEG
jgi:hypothetical protein